MGTIYGYGCVSSPKIPRTDPEAIKKTKAYSELEETFERLGLPKDNIRVDLITGTYRKRKYLDYILEHGGDGDCVIIETMSALGFSPAEIASNYKKLYMRNIGLYVADEMQRRMLMYSTAISQFAMDDDFKYEGGAEPFVITRNLSRLMTEPVKNRQGRAFMKRPENFKRVYWLYENYFIQEKDTYHNRLIDMGKKRFYRLAQEYEELDPQYEADLKEQDELYSISEKPKRHGVVPENFEKVLEGIDSGLSPEEACEKAGCRNIPEIDIKRYALKLKGGRSAVALANRYKDSIVAMHLRDGVLN